MVEALTIERLKKEVEGGRYEHDERRIVGIMLARYEIPEVREIINSSYNYWDENSQRDFDVFWAGYGAYLYPDEVSKGKIILDFPDNRKRVYYDQKAFVTIKNECNRIFKKKYKDYMQMVLLNYHDGRLWFEESLCMDLKNDKESIYEIMEWLIEECSTKSCVEEIKLSYGLKKIKDIVKKITLSDAIAVLGIFKGI